MNYIYIAIFAWSVFGVVAIMEKFLLSKPMRDAEVLTFYNGIFSIFSLLVFLPFARFSSWQHFLLDLFSGFIFLLADYFLFLAMIKTEISRVIPVSGVFAPIFALIISKLALGIILTKGEFLAFGCFVLGTFLISYQRGKFKKEMLWAVLSAFLLGVYYSLLKKAYHPFAANYSFVRLGSFFGALLMLLLPEARRAIANITQNLKNSTTGLFLTKEIIAGVAFVFINYAVGIGNPAIANALEGFEFAIIFILALLISKYYPKIFKEQNSPKLILQKSIAIILLFCGLFVLEIVK